MATTVPAYAVADQRWPGQADHEADLADLQVKSMSRLQEVDEQRLKAAADLSIVSRRADTMHRDTEAKSFQVDALHDTIASLRKHIDDLKADLAGARHAIESRDAQIAKNTRDLAEVGADRIALQTLNGVLHGRIDDLETRLSAYPSVQRRLEQQIEAQGQELVRQAKQVQAMKEVDADRCQQMASMQGDAVRLRKGLARKRQQYDSLCADIRNLVEQIDRGHTRTHDWTRHLHRMYHRPMAAWCDAATEQYGADARPSTWTVPATRGRRNVESHLARPTTNCGRMTTSASGRGKRRSRWRWSVSA